MSYLTLNKGVAPSAPATGKESLYADSEGRLKTLDATGVSRTLSDSARSNWIRNSGFWFAQRQAPGTATTYSTTTTRLITADGWGITNENASTTYQRTDTIAAPEASLQGEFYGNFLKITTLGKLLVTQVLEAKDTAALRGRSVRLQCWMKQLVGASPVIRLGIIQLNSAGTADTIPATFVSAFGANGTDPTLGTNLAYIAPKATVTPDNATTSGNAASCTLTSIWQRFGAVFDIPTDCKNIIVMLWGNAQFVATNGFAVAQVSLTDGMELQDWTPWPYESELVRVQRYYAKTFAIDTAPVQNAGVATGCLRCILGKAAATALAAQFQWRYPTNLRVAAVTLTTYNPAAANVQVRQIGGTAADLTATATANSTEQAIDITATGVAAGTVGDQCGVHVTADSEL